MKIFFSKLLRNLVAAKTSPDLAIVSFVVLIFIITISIFNNQLISAIIIICLGVIGTIFLLYIRWLTNQETIRMSDIINQPNYNYNTIYSELNWILLDDEGKEAKLEKRKKLKANEQLVQVKEYAWGDGIPPKVEDFTAGKHKVLDVFRQGSEFVILIGLDREYKRGEEFEIIYSKRIINAFLSNNEWVETTITTNSAKLMLSVTFPKGRNYIEAEAVHKHGDFTIRNELGKNNFFEIKSNDGLNKLIWIINKPIPRDTYTIEWKW